MFADNAEPNPNARPVTPIELRNAYLGVFQSMAAATDETQPPGLVQAIEKATHTIYKSGAPMGGTLDRCARKYGEYWESQFAAQPLEREPALKSDFMNWSDPAEDILAPYIRSYALSGLAFDGSAVLAAAQRFGKGKTWVKDMLDIRMFELPQTIQRAMSKKATRVLMHYAMQSLDTATTIDVSKH